MLPNRKRNIPLYILDPPGVMIQFFDSLQAMLVTKVFNFACLHTTYKTTVVSISDINAIAKRKMSIIKLLKKEFLLELKLLLSTCPFCKSKNFFFYADTEEQNLSMFLVHSINLN